MPVLRLMSNGIRGLKAKSNGKRETYRDIIVPGLIVDAHASGRRTFIVWGRLSGVALSNSRLSNPRKAGSAFRLTLGTFLPGVYDLADARRDAREAMYSAFRGEDPRAQKRHMKEIRKQRVASREPSPSKKEEIKKSIAKALQKTSQQLFEPQQPTSLGNPDLIISGEDVIKAHQPVVYAWIQEDKVMYIGKGESGLSRPLSSRHEHLKKIRPNDVLLVWRFANRDQAATKEAEMIYAVKPVLNRHGKG